MSPYIDRCGEDALEQFMYGVFVSGTDFYDLDGEILLRRSRDGRIETCGDHWIESETNYAGGQP